MSPFVSIVIATHNMGHLIRETLDSCRAQEYQNTEIIVYDDASTDGTENAFNWELARPKISYYRGKENKGVGRAFNCGINLANGEIIILMCADDLFTDKRVIGDIVNLFQSNLSIGHVSRWYHQFVGDDRRPVRAWRTVNPIVQANNPSGLAFRRKALVGAECSNNMFIETSKLVNDVISNGWDHRIIKWDTIAVRVHPSTSTQRNYWLKRRVSSPVMDWHKIGGEEISRDYVSLVQIKNGFTVSAVWEEICNFVKLRPINLLHPSFWFFAIISLVTPRFILRRLPDIYRRKFGRLITKEVKRP